MTCSFESELNWYADFIAPIASCSGFSACLPETIKRMSNAFFDYIIGLEVKKNNYIFFS